MSNEILYKLLTKTLNSLEKLKDNGSFLISSIELDWDLDGQEYEKELDELIADLKQEVRD